MLEPIRLEAAATINYGLNISGTIADVKNFTKEIIDIIDEDWKPNLEKSKNKLYLTFQYTGKNLLPAKAYIALPENYDNTNSDQIELCINYIGILQEEPVILNKEIVCELIISLFLGFLIYYTSRNNLNANLTNNITHIANNEINIYTEIHKLEWEEEKKRIMLSKKQNFTKNEDSKYYWQMSVEEQEQFKKAFLLENKSYTNYVNRLWKKGEVPIWHKLTEYEVDEETSAIVLECYVLYWRCKKHLNELADFYIGNGEIDNNAFWEIIWGESLETENALAKAEQKALELQTEAADLAQKSLDDNSKPTETNKKTIENASSIDANTTKILIILIGVITLFTMIYQSLNISF